MRKIYLVVKSWLSLTIFFLFSSMLWSFLKLTFAADFFAAAASLASGHIPLGPPHLAFEAVDAGPYSTVYAEKHTALSG